MREAGSNDQSAALDTARKRGDGSRRLARREKRRRLAVRVGLVRCRGGYLRAVQLRGPGRGAAGDEPRVSKGKRRKRRAAGKDLPSRARPKRLGVALEHTGQTRGPARETVGLLLEQGHTGDRARGWPGGSVRGEVSPGHDVRHRRRAAEATAFEKKRKRRRTARCFLTKKEKTKKRKGSEPRVFCSHTTTSSVASFVIWIFVLVLRRLRRVS